MVHVTDEEFEQLVEDAVARIPKRFAEHLENVSFMVAEAPTRAQGPLLGLYEGIPLPDRSFNYTGVLPDVITVFKLPHLHMARDLDELREEVRHTVWHEVAHYFGLDHRGIEALED
jgi:predicted Zn-dependent protease with MMP-like domain